MVVVYQPSSPHNSRYLLAEGYNTVRWGKLDISPSVRMRMDHRGR